MYIGKTNYDNPYRRWKEHLRDSKNEKDKKRPLYIAMKKYGTEHFHFEVIEGTENTEEREQYWIEKLRTYVGFDDCNGYNATLGGDGKPYLNLNEEEVVKYHIYDAYHILQYTANHFKADHHTIRQILNKNKTKWLNRKDSRDMRSYIEGYDVFQISPKSKMIINIFINVKEAELYTKIKQCNIKGACGLMSGYKSHFSGGYLWYYGKDVPQAIKNGEILNIGSWC